MESADLLIDIGGERARGRRVSLEEQVARFYERHYETFFHFMVTSGCSADDAREYVQEGFLRLFEFLKSGKRIEKPRNWLFRVLYRLRVDGHRRTSRESESPLASWEALASTSLDPELQLLNRERLERLHRAVRTLTVTQCEYLLLRAEGLKFREIAEIYDVAVGSVSEVCGRAVEKLGKLSNE